MSATPKILNIGLNIKTNNISVTVSDNSLNLNTTTLSNGYYICIYDSTEFNVFSNFILNIIISDIIKKMLLASGTIFDINPNFQTILKGNAKHNVYEFISYPKNTIDIDDDVFKTSLQYYIELLILSSSKNLKFTNSLINSNYPFFQLDSGELIL
jgi:hypothetical protein